MAKKTTQKNGDPWPYEGPIERADGKRPFNHYLWPSESWWANREINHVIDPRWHFGIIALADGRFATEGAVWAIEQNSYDGRPCVFATRTEAIRIAAARMIRCARGSRYWKGYNCGGLKGRQLDEVINWARRIVAKETGKAEPRPVHVKEPSPVRRKTGLPLFDLAFV